MGEARRRKQALEREEREYERLPFLWKVVDAFRALPFWIYVLLAAALLLATGYTLREVLHAML
jgi:hypothetical protein